MDIIVKNSFVDMIRDGYPLITSDMVDYQYSVDDEGKTALLFDRNRRYLATAYIGKQNKGLAWVYSYSRIEKLNYDFLQRKIAIAFDNREKIFNSKTTTAFRLFNTIGDGIGGLTIDYYAGFVLLNWYNIGIFNYKDDIVDIIRNLFDVKGIYQKVRFKSKEHYANHVWGEKTPEDFYVLENRVKYNIDFEDGNMVGIFLDQRDVRKFLTGKFSENKTVLNTFSYTGAFSIACLAGNAQKTTSVDLAKRSLEWTKSNIKVNDFDVDQQDVIVEDVFNYFNYANRKKLKFDIIILDPPSFARSKKRTFSVLKNYTELIESILPLVNENGYIIASSNNSQLTSQNFKRMITRALKNNDIEYNFQKLYRLPEDFKVMGGFPEGNYLKVFVVKVGK